MSLLNFNKRRARKLHDQAMALQDEGRDDEAIPLYSRAIALDPLRSQSHYNIGLIYKYRNDWQRCLEYNQVAYTEKIDAQFFRDLIELGEIPALQRKAESLQHSAGPEPAQ